MREQGLSARRPAIRSPLQPRHHVARLAWARQHLRFRNGQWDRVLFTDECRINLSRADGRQRVYRRHGERYANNCIQDMIWGGICSNHQTNLVILDGVSPACDTVMRSNGTTSRHLCGTIHKGLCFSRTMPVLMLPESCRMNSKPETLKSCPGQPIPLICHQLNMSGTS